MIAGIDLSDLLPSTSLGEIVGFVLVSFVTAAAYRFMNWYKARQKAKHYDVTTTMHIDQNITELIRQMREETHASRVQVLRFHNGSNFFDGSPMKRVSCTHEAVGHGVSTEMMRQQNIPVSMFAPGMADIMENDPKVRFVEQLPASHYKAIKEVMCVFAYKFLPIYKNKLLVGAVVLHFVDQGFLENPVPEEVFRRYTTLVELELAKDA